MRAKYKVTTEGQVTLAAAGSVRTVLGVLGGTGIGVDLLEVYFSFDGLDAAQPPIVVELCYCTYATNPPSTNSTAVTPLQVAGRAIASSFTAAKQWTTEPTVLSTTILEEFEFDPNKGVYRYKYSLGDEYDTDAADGFALRMTAPTASSTVAKMRGGFVVARV